MTPVRIEPAAPRFLINHTKTSQLSYSDKLKNCNFVCGKFRYDTFQKANDKDADQAAQMRRLVCNFVVNKPKRQVLASRTK